MTRLIDCGVCDAVETTEIFKQCWTLGDREQGSVTVLRVLAMRVA